MDDFDGIKQAFFSEVNRFKKELLESNAVDRPQVISERLVKQLQDHTEFLREELRNKNNMINCLLEQLSKRGDTIFTYKNKVNNSKQKLSDLHTAQSNSNTYFRGRYKSNKSQSGSQFHDNTSFNKSFNTEVSIDDAISPYSQPTKELVISSHKNMNNDNNSKSVENNFRECDVGTTVIIVDDY